MMTHALVDTLASWTDWDYAAYLLGRSIGLFENQNFHVDVKHVFWTDNPLDNGLHEALLSLVRADVVEHRYSENDDSQFRWIGVQH